MIYVPSHFSESDPGRQFAFMREHGFATLISGTPGEPEVSHLPLLVDEARGVLRGHMARANPQWRSFHEAQSVVAVFHGPHQYISPAWYRTQPSVPTWNYAVVHVSGAPRLVDNRSAVESFLAELVETHEGIFETPWRMDLPADYLDAMIAAIVYFEIDIVSVTGKFKLSQNRPAEDRPEVVAALERLGGSDAIGVAQMMRTRMRG